MIVNYVILILIVVGVQDVKCVYQVVNKVQYVLIHHQVVLLMNGYSKQNSVKLMMLVSLEH